MSEVARNYIETLSPVQHKLLLDILGFRIKKITWDFDQILFDSETPVKEEFFKKTNIDYRDRKIDQWLALSNWANSEGKFSFEDAKAVEAPIWEDPRVLVQARPIEAFRWYSKIAFLKGIEQSVVTTRTSKLKEATLISLRKYYGWIDLNSVHIRNGDLTPGDEFKGIKVGAISPDVHFEDSTGSTASVLKHSEASVVLFPRKLEMGRFQNNDRVLELLDTSILSSLKR